MTVAVLKYILFSTSDHSSSLLMINSKLNTRRYHRFKQKTSAAESGVVAIMIEEMFK